jgi:glycosyltransferase involved in cell wall biosynthesis
MQPIRILIDSFADAGLLNAQMGNAREIIYRLDPDIFHVSTFVLGQADPRIVARKNTRLIQLPQRRQTVRILSEFLVGSHELLFYMKASPASKWYSSLRKKWRDRRTTVGTIESQCIFKMAPGVLPEAIQLWEETILRCDHLYSNSASVRRSLQLEYGRSSGVIPTGADTRFYTPVWERTPNRRPRILFAGSLCRRKHPEVVLAAAAQFPQADFTLVGEGHMREELTTRITNEGLRNVALTGALGAVALRDQYRSADIFLLPSTFEGSPKVVVEAAACGLPVIIRDSYWAETVIHGVTGFQAASNEGMFSYLRLLLDEPELRERFGRAGREHSTKFDWDCITAQWATAFAELTSDRRLKRRAS